MVPPLEAMVPRGIKVKRGIDCLDTAFHSMIGILYVLIFFPCLVLFYSNALKRGRKIGIDLEFLINEKYIVSLVFLRTFNFYSKIKKKKKLMKFGKSKAFVRLLLFEKRLMLI